MTNLEPIPVTYRQMTGQYSLSSRDCFANLIMTESQMRDLAVVLLETLSAKQRDLVFKQTMPAQLHTESV